MLAEVVEMAGRIRVYVGVSKEPKCPVCKKRFIQYTPDWYWRHGDKILCSYKCMRVLEKADNEKSDGKRTYGNAAGRRTNEERVRASEHIDVPGGMTPYQREMKVVELRQKHFSYGAIAKAVGYSEGNIKVILHRHGILNPASFVSREELNTYIRQYQNGMSIENIARRHRRAYSTVRRHLIDEGIVIRKRGGAHVDCVEDEPGDCNETMD